MVGPNPYPWLQIGNTPNLWVSWHKSEASAPRTRCHHHRGLRRRKTDNPGKAGRCAEPRKTTHKTNLSTAGAEPTWAWLAQFSFGFLVKKYQLRRKTCYSIFDDSAISHRGVLRLDMDLCWLLARFRGHCKDFSPVDRQVSHPSMEKYALGFHHRESRFGASGLSGLLSGRQ